MMELVYRDAGTPAGVRITHFLLDQGPADRRAICAACGLAWTSAFDALKKLLTQGGVERYVSVPVEGVRRPPGRPRVLYRFCNSRPLLLEVIGEGTDFDDEVILS